MYHALLSRFLDRALEASPRARELCAALEGRRLRLDITGLPVAPLVTARAGGLVLGRGDEAAGADVTLRGGPLALWSLAGGDIEGAVARGVVSISGDEGIARQFQELGGLLRPDLEALLGPLLGRIPAHLAARMAGAFGGWSRAARESLLRTAADYLAHESRDLVPRAEAEGFLGGVEALRAQLARAEARTAQLGTALAGAAARAARRGTA